MSFDPAAQGWRRYEDKALPQVTPGQWIREEGEGFAFGFETGSAQENGRGVIHGGILATYIDHTIGRTAYRAAKAAAVATIQLDLHYLAAVRAGDFVEARAEVTRLTRAVIFLRGTLAVGDRAVLAASGIWKILGR
ncbi:PaaI family thioesterase [Falsiroseomonas sp. CW058]|uniref:PaaI family thioesterase n=1 Tax=Falsiroseomonas sp. CW058 TaxID=3388664 RepID=UPI003D31DD90